MHTYSQCRDGFNIEFKDITYSSNAVVRKDTETSENALVGEIYQVYCQHAKGKTNLA